MYGSSSIDSDNNGVRGSGIDSSEQCEKRADSMFDLLSNLYSELNTISVGTNKLSSCFTSYCLLTTYPINYCPMKRVNNFCLRRPFYSK